MANTEINLPNCPKGGTGVHRWMWACAFKLKDAGCPQAQAVHIIRSLMTRAETSGDEVSSSVANAYHKKEDPDEIRERWPRFDPLVQAQVVAGGPSLLQLRAFSPGSLDASMDEVLLALFRPEELLCFGFGKNEFTTKTLQEWLGDDRRVFVTPSPMRAKFGRTKQGRISQHCEDNTGPRRFLVVEFDQGGTDTHAAVAWHLAEFAPLVLSVFSGGKSLHSWFNVAGWSEPEARKFFDYAVSLGGDRAMWRRFQFARAPQGWNPDKQARQTVQYFNPGAGLEAIQ